MEKMHGKRNERCWHDVGGSKQESSRQGCVEEVCLWPIPCQGLEAMMMNLNLRKIGSRTDWEWRVSP